jgi:hypothetical protein
MHTCPWCSTNYVNWHPQCPQCGGRMAEPAGMSLGPPPPDAPRKLPKGYATRIRWTRSLEALLGGVFTLMGSMMMVPMLVHKMWLPALFPAFFFIGGVSIFVRGWRQASGVLHAFRYGIAVRGEIRSVDKDTSQSYNGRHPWRLTYTFTVNDQIHDGQVISFADSVAVRSRGEPLWVLYEEDDPTVNTVFPPMG